MTANPDRPRRRPTRRHDRGAPHEPGASPVAGAVVGILAALSVDRARRSATATR